MVNFARLSVICLWSLIGLPAFAVDEAQDLQSIASAAHQRGVPVMVIFSSQHCGFCERLQADYVDPMLLQSAYTDHLIIRRVTIDRGAEIVDFAGAKVSSDAFAKRYGVRVTPTVLLLDPKGNAVTKKIEGYTSPAFYGAYLDDAIEQAQSVVNATRVRDAAL